MAFSDSTFISFIVTIATLLNVDGFTVIPRNEMQSCVKQFRTFSRAVTMSSADSIVGSDDDEPEQEAEPKDFLVTAGELDEEQDTSGISFADMASNPKFQFEEQIKESREKFRRHDKDTGSTEFQVAGMTERITYLTAHLKKNQKDFSTRRGLVALVNKRRRLLNYLYKEDVKRYEAIVSAMGIRHKAPGRVQSREDKYSRFPAQKPRRDGK